MIAQPECITQNHSTLPLPKLDPHEITMRILLTTTTLLHNMVCVHTTNTHYIQGCWHRNKKQTLCQDHHQTMMCSNSSHFRHQVDPKLANTPSNQQNPMGLCPGWPVGSPTLHSSERRRTSTGRGRANCVGSGCFERSGTLQAGQLITAGS